MRSTRRKDNRDGRGKKTRKLKYSLQLHKDTRVMILYISYMRYLKRSWTVEQILRDSSAFIGDEHYLFGLKLKELANKHKLRRLSSTEFQNLLKKSIGNTKYKTRQSPPFSASPLCGYILTGNDGRAYKSVSVRNGACVWKLTHDVAHDID